MVSAPGRPSLRTGASQSCRPLVLRSVTRRNGGVEQAAAGGHQGLAVRLLVPSLSRQAGAMPTTTFASRPVRYLESSGPARPPICYIRSPLTARLPPRPAVDLQ